MKLVKLNIILQTISFNGFLAVILVVALALAGGTRSQAWLGVPAAREVFSF